MAQYNLAELRRIFLPCGVAESCIRVGASFEQQFEGFQLVRADSKVSNVQFMVPAFARRIWIGAMVQQQPSRCGKFPIGKSRCSGAVKRRRAVRPSSCMHE